MNDASNESPTTPAGPRQLYCPRRLLLCTFNGASGAGGSVSFRVNLPDSRLHWKAEVLGVPEGNASPAVLLAGRGLKIWTAALADDDVKGGRGTPVTNISGTAAAGAAFPSAGLGGYSIENFTTAADGIQGVITVPAQLGGVKGALYLQARYQPATFQIVPWEQWDEIRSACDLRLLSDVLHT